ncbi:hypothetical protein TNCV_4573191 [Trichonephila clavipes]|nr:hypothetical protein TNCV_4573191 [Trichonephila clavipes]
MIASLRFLSNHSTTTKSPTCRRIDAHYIRENSPPWQNLETGMSVQVSSSSRPWFENTRFVLNSLYVASRRDNNNPSD